MAQVLTYQTFNVSVLKELLLLIGYIDRPVLWPKLKRIILYINRPRIIGYIDMPVLWPKLKKIIGYIDRPRIIGNIDRPVFWPKY